MIRNAAVVALAAFAAYAAFAARDVMFGDGLEFIVSAARNGVAHPPGYPLWIVLGHLATLLPFGTLPQRVNLTAAIYHAITVGLVYCSAYVLVKRPLPAFFAAILLAIGSPLFVHWSLQAEVFSLNDVFAAAIVLVCLLWLEEPARYRLVIPLALLFGLGLSNHQTLLLLAPLPLWCAWCGRKALREAQSLTRTIGIALLALLAGFWVPYIHTLQASYRLSGWEFLEARNFDELLGLIERRAYGTFALVSAQSAQGGSAWERLRLLVSLGAWPYLAAAVGAIALAIRRRRRELVFAALTVAGPLVFFAFVANFNLDTQIARGIFSRFGLLPLVAVAPFAACCASALAVIGNVRTRIALETALTAVVLVVFAVRLPAYSLAGDTSLRAFATDVYAWLPPRAILLTASEAVEIVPFYFQGVEHWRADVVPVSYGYLSQDSYRLFVAQTIVVPPVTADVFAPNQKRDLLVRANPERPFFVVGDRPIHAPGPLSQPLVLGVVSQMIPLNLRVDARKHYRREVEIQSASGYGAVSDDFWNSNGYGDETRAFYAGGFFTAGIDAKALGDTQGARYWFERARQYSDDPLIDRELSTL